MGRQQILNENGSPVLPTRATLGQEASREPAQTQRPRHSKRSDSGRFHPVLEQYENDRHMSAIMTTFPLVQKPPRRAQPRTEATTGLASMGVERHGKSSATENESGFSNGD